MEEKDLFEEIETQRLILRKIVDTDAEMLYNNIYNNFEYYKFYYQIPFNSFEDYKPLVEKYKEYYANGNYFKWGVVLKETNEIIGLVQFHTKDLMNKSCKIGYIIGYNYNKKGYAHEAAKAILEFGFNKIGFHRIDAYVVSENIKSIKLAESLGMHFESIRQDGYKLGDKYYNQNIYTIIKGGH